MYILVLVSCPDEETAVRIGRTAVENRLAACITVIPRVKSVYRWKGQVEEADEVLLLIKTRGELFQRLEEAIVERHPYSVPEIISIRINQGHTPYLEWIKEET